MDFYGVIDLFQDGSTLVQFGFDENGLLLYILAKIHIHDSRLKMGLTQYKRSFLAVGAPTVSPTANLAVGAPTVSPSGTGRGGAALILKLRLGGIYKKVPQLGTELIYGVYVQK